MTRITDRQLRDDWHSPETKPGIAGIYESYWVSERLDIEMHGYAKWTPIEGWSDTCATVQMAEEMIYGSNVQDKYWKPLDDGQTS